MICCDRRSLLAQQRAREKEVMSQTKNMQSTLAIGKSAMQVGPPSISSHTSHSVRPVYSEQWLDMGSLSPTDRGCLANSVASS